MVLGDGAHNRIGETEAAVSVSVEGPSVQGAVPATNPAGQPVRVELSAEDVEMVPADGDTSGRTGHFHIFIDTDPTAPGQVVPPAEPGRILHTAERAVNLEGLAAGEHFIWIVLGDGAHRAFDPQVAHRLTFTIQ